MQSRREWFIPVLGNHELFLLQCEENGTLNWQLNGGTWWQKLTSEERAIAKACILNDYHLTLSVDTVLGKIGVVHAQFPLQKWPMSVDDINQSNIFQLMWDRDIIQQNKGVYFAGIDYLISGHTPVKMPMLKGQQLFIDTGSGHKPSDYIDNPRLTICEPKEDEFYLYSFNGELYQESKIKIGG